MDLAQRYIRLAHGIDVQSEGFIDGYGGPAEWADRSARTPAELQAEAETLLAGVDAVEDPARREWLRVQLRAMHTMTRLLGGEALPYAEEVHGLYDIDPPCLTVEELEASLDALERAVPGAGPLPGRLDTLRRKVALARGQILELAVPILAELRRRTKERFGLPDGEDFSISLVEGKPWSGYNWPLGNLKSRIDLNTDLPLALPALPDLLAHEGYPGHHTEHAIKEALLVRERGWHEHHLQLIGAPECVISEGIAMNALDAVMPKAEVEAWLTGDLAARAGLNAADVRAFLHATRAQASLKGVSGAAALRLHEDGLPEADVLAFLERYGAMTPERARHSLRFIQNPSFRAYIFTYSVGAELVRTFMAAHGDAGFARLLREPLTPGMGSGEWKVGSGKSR